MDPLAVLPPSAATIIAHVAVYLSALAMVLTFVGPRIAAKWPAASPYIRFLLDLSTNILGALVTLKAQRPLDPEPTPLEPK